MQEDQTVTCFRALLWVRVCVCVSAFRCDNAAELNWYCSQGSRVVIQYSPVSALQAFSRGLLCFTECVSNVEQVVHHRVCWFYTRAHTHTEEGNFEQRTLKCENKHFHQSLSLSLPDLQHFDMSFIYNFQFISFQFVQLVHMLSQDNQRQDLRLVETSDSAITFYFRPRWGPKGRVFLAISWKRTHYRWHWYMHLCWGPLMHNIFHVGSIF